MVWAWESSETGQDAPAVSVSENWAVERSGILDSMYTQTAGTVKTVYIYIYIYIYMYLPSDWTGGADRHELTLWHCICTSFLGLNSLRCSMIQPAATHSSSLEGAMNIIETTEHGKMIFCRHVLTCVLTYFDKRSCPHIAMSPNASQIFVNCLCLSKKCQLCGRTWSRSGASWRLLLEFTEPQLIFSGQPDWIP